MKKIKLILMALILAGCSTLYPTWNKTSQDIISSAKVSEDTFDKTKTINFPKVTPYTLQDRKDVLGQWETLPGQFYLRGVIKESNPVKYQIIIATNNASEWGFYERALDSDGNKLDFSKAGADVKTSYSSALPVEYMTITLSEDYLKSHINNNLIIKVYGQKKDFVFYVPQSYLEGVYKYFHEEPLSEGKK